MIREAIRENFPGILIFGAIVLIMVLAIAGSLIERWIEHSASPAAVYLCLQADGERYLVWTPEGD